MIHSQTGFAFLLPVIIMAAVGAAIGGAFLYIQHKDNTITKQATTIATLQSEVFNFKATVVEWEGKWKSRDLLDEARQIRDVAARDAQIENAVKAEQGKQKANASKIRETSMRDAEKYEGFTERVMWKNFDVIRCDSDLRNMRDEKACIGSIR